MITQTLKLWSKPIKQITYAAPPPPPPSPTKMISSVNNGGDFVHWSPGKEALVKGVAEIMKDLHEVWGKTDKDKYAWIKPGARCRPLHPEQRQKWSKELEVIRCARNFYELNGTYPLPKKDETTLYPIFVRIVQQGRKDTGTVFRCTPDFLEELKDGNESV